MELIRRVSRDGVKAIKAFFKSNIINRDIKPENIIFNPQREFSSIQFIDFGLSVKRSPGSPKETRFCGTPGFMAPEVCLGMEYDEAVDIWSLGMTLLEFATNKYFFEFDKDALDATAAIDDSDVQNRLRSLRRDFIGKQEAVIKKEHNESLIVKKDKLKREFGEMLAKLEHAYKIGLLSKVDYEKRCEQVTKKHEKDLSVIEGGDLEELSKKFAKVPLEVDDFLDFIKRLLTVSPRHRKENFAKIEECKFFKPPKGSK